MITRIKLRCARARLTEALEAHNAARETGETQRIQSTLRRLRQARHAVMRLEVRG